MKKNVGKTEKYFRLVFGLVAIVLGLFYKSWWGLIGTPLVITAIINWCPAYVPFGISTCKADEK